MRKVIIVLVLVAAFFLSDRAFAGKQTRDRSRDQTRTTYQPGTQNQTPTTDQQRSRDQDRTRTRERLKGGSPNTTSGK